MPLSSMVRSRLSTGSFPLPSLLRSSGDGSGPQSLSHLSPPGSTTGVVGLPHRDRGSQKRHGCPVEQNT